MIHFILSALLGYLFGSIPFGLILAKAFGYGDIRKIGSGNIGATNVLRTGNKPLAFVTLVCDAGKGAFAVFISVLLFDNFEASVLAGFGAILGHTFPVWLKFKGGKGVATTLGTLLAISLPVGATACLTWLFMAFTFKYSSLSALIAMLVAPVATYLFLGNLFASVVIALITVLVWVRHHTNIRRLLSGEEPKIGAGRNSV